MQKRVDAQRQHIIYSFDALLYQLHVISFFQSPSLWDLLCRLYSQVQCSKPRTVDPNRSLRFWFLAVLFFNATSLWHHATQGAVEGKTIVLDFIGMARVPSKAQLLLLDFTIIFLQMLLATISYETSLAQELPPDAGLLDPLLPLPPSPQISFPPLPMASTSTFLDPLHKTSSPPPAPPARPTTPYVIDLRFAHILARLRSTSTAAGPTPSPTLASLLATSGAGAGAGTSAGAGPGPGSSPLLPLPNTTSLGNTWNVPLPHSVGVFVRARAQMRRWQEQAEEGNRVLSGNTGADAAGDRARGTGRELPGRMDQEGDGL